MLVIPLIIRTCGLSFKTGLWIQLEQLTIGQFAYKCQLALIYCSKSLAAWQLVVWFGISWWLLGSYLYLFHCYVGKFVGLIYWFNVLWHPGLMEKRWWLITSTSRLTILCWWLYFFLIYIALLQHNFILRAAH